MAQPLKVCFDTAPLIWGVRGESSSTQANMIERTKLYIATLAEQRATIIVPTVVLAEYLEGVSEGDMAGEIGALHRGFVVEPFDPFAAKIAAVLRQNEEVRDLYKRDDDSVHKTCIKVDVMVVATAIATEADFIVSHDSHLATIAAGRIEIRQVPEGSRQPDLGM